MDNLTGIGGKSTISKALINSAFSFLESDEYNAYKQYESVRDPEQPNIKRLPSQTRSMQDAQTQVTTRPKYKRSISDNAEKSPVHVSMQHPVSPDDQRGYNNYKYRNPNVINIRLDGDDRSKKTHLHLTNKSHLPPEQSGYTNPAYQTSPRSPINLSFDTSHDSYTSSQQYNQLPPKTSQPLDTHMQPAYKQLAATSQHRYVAGAHRPTGQPQVSNISVISHQSNSDKMSELHRQQQQQQQQHLHQQHSFPPTPKTWSSGLHSNDKLDDVDGGVMSSSCMSRKRCLILGIIIALVLLVVVAAVLAVIFVVGKLNIFTLFCHIHFQKKFSSGMIF